MKRLPKEIKIISKFGIGDEKAGRSFAKKYLKIHPNVNYVLVLFLNGHVWINRNNEKNFLDKLTAKYPDLFVTKIKP